MQVDRASSITERVTTVILCAWAGGLWIICGMVVPALFWFMDDNKLAGEVATQLFYIETVLATLFGLMYWALRRPLLDDVTKRWLWLAISAPLVFLLLLRPIMNAARAAGDMARFGQLHSVASLLFLTACLAVGMVVWGSAARHRAE